MTANITDRLVAHRGFSWHYPENTVAACEAALALGIKRVEVDVQLDRDGRPVLAHDIDVGGEPLEGLARFLAQSGAFAFVEAKGESILRFGARAVWQAIRTAMAGADGRWALISFSGAVLKEAEGARGLIVTDLVTPQHRAAQCGAKWLFINQIFGGNAKYEPGDAQWVVYAMENRAQCERAFGRGAALVETGRLTQIIGEYTEW
jgi:hypothetical protein